MSAPFVGPSNSAFSSLSELASAVRARRVSAVEVTREYLARVSKLDPSLGCFLRLLPAHALAQAEKVDARVAQGEDLPLAGVPVAHKDALCTRGIETTCASKILQGFVPPYDATVVERLTRAGAVLFGKLNMDEFAMGSSNENSAYFPCKNPWDLDRVPGGSSGGSAAAVAADLVPLTLGSDTGGSIRQPASFCGVTGLKPTYGRVSRYGLVAFASSLDQVGPFARSAEDAALALSVIGGHDPHDATSLTAGLPEELARLQPLPSLAGLRIGLPREYFQAGLDPQIEAAVHAAAKALVAEGATLVDVTLPHTQHAVAVYYILATAEASSNLARFDGVRYGRRRQPTPTELSGGQSALFEMYCRTRSEGFGAEVKRRILLGTYVLRSGYYDAYYRRAGQVRALLRDDFARAFSVCDVLLTPTSPALPFRFGERSTDPLAMYLSDVYTLSCSLAGLPGVSIPCGFATPADSQRPLPIGLQLIGPALREAQILALAATYQRLTDWHVRRPALAV